MVTERASIRDVVAQVHTLTVEMRHAPTVRDVGTALGYRSASAVQYRIANLAGRSVGVAAALDKALLPPSRHAVSVP